MLSSKVRLLVKSNRETLSKWCFRRWNSAALTQFAYPEVHSPIEYEVQEVKFPSVGGYVAGKIDNNGKIFTNYSNLSSFL